MLDIKTIRKEKDFPIDDRNAFVDFLHHHLGRYGDPVSDIQKCLDYAFSEEKCKGGFALMAYYDQQLVGGLIMNKTSMSGYIPGNILVYIAVNADFRGKGFGSQIIKKAFQETDGDIKLHVDYDNPALKLYERLGFENKYAEMRYYKDTQ